MRDAVDQMGRMGSRAPLPAHSARSVLGGKAQAISEGRRLSHLLTAQAGQRMLSACPRQGFFLCRTSRSDRPLILTTRPCEHPPGAMTTMQASVSFAARAALAMPPVLSSMQWMGAPLLPMNDPAMACRLLLAFGAHRVLVISPQPSPLHEPDALELASLSSTHPWEHALPERAGVLKIRMPDDAGALNFSKSRACREAEKQAAAQALDAMLDEMGLTRCRILPFRAGSAQ